MVDPEEYLFGVLADDPDGRIDQVPNKRPSEQTVVDSLQRTIQQRDDLWVDTEVNLWEKNAAREGAAVPPQDVIRTIEHPLQPDIDLLVCSLENGTKRPPLVGIEAKYFGRYNGIAGHKLLPKRVDANGNAMGGFYSGLGQALSLLSMGLDAVYLWHVFEIPEAIYDGDRDQRDEHIEILNGYTREIKRLLGQYDIPIGYFANGMLPAFDNRFLSLTNPRRANPNEYTEAQTRQFLETVLASEVASAGETATLAELDGSGRSVTVEATVSEIVFVRKDSADMPDLKGILHSSESATKRPFVVDSGVSHPYFEPGCTYRFENAVDHWYAAAGETQVLVTDGTDITEL